MKNLISLNNDKFVKKLIESGMSKKKAWEINFHLYEIDAFCMGYRANIEGILKSKTKKETDEHLESIWDELENHVIKNHMIPVKKLLEKELFKDD